MSRFNLNRRLNIAVGMTIFFSTLLSLTLHLKLVSVFRESILFGSQRPIALFIQELLVALVCAAAGTFIVYWYSKTRIFDQFETYIDRTSRHVRDQEQLLHNVFQALPDNFIVFDNSFKFVISSEPSMHQLYGSRITKADSAIEYLIQSPQFSESQLNGQYEIWNLLFGKGKEAWTEHSSKLFNETSPQGKLHKISYFPIYRNNRLTHVIAKVQANN